MRTPRMLAMLGLLLTAAVALGACGGDDADQASSGGGQTEQTEQTEQGGDDGGDEGAVRIEATEFAFSPGDVTIKAGEPTTVEFVNAGSVEHDFTVDDIDFKVTAAAAKTGTGELTVPEAGEYTFYCSVPGHREGGMEGTLVVE
ncbi:MAG: cupredoxin domain-containing protein [Acidimicrobiia bacterium]|nr:cupredoxin domain-containing protein [Acidimicrobiia bacterium]